MEKSEGCVMFEIRRAALEVRLGMLGAMMDLNSAEEEGLYLPVTSGRYLFKGPYYLG